MSYSQSWLENPSAIRIVLVVAKVFDIVQNTTVEVYLSNSGYITTDGKVFDPTIVGTISLSESFGSEDSISMSWGDIEISNRNGEYDEYLDASKYVWSNREIKIYYGDPGWASSLTNLATTFLKIFDGVIEDCDSKSRDSFILKIRDKLERLNSPISEAVIGEYGVWADASQQNKEQLKPIVFGEVFNSKPLLIDPSQLEYMFSCSNPEKTGSTVNNNGYSELLIEIRDNGAPVYISSDTVNYGGAEVNLLNSTFKLKSPPAGEITVSVQGVKKSVDMDTGAVLNIYNNTIAQLIAVIVLSFGKSSTRFTATDVDWDNFKTFNLSNPIPAGVLVSDLTNVLEVCQGLAKSIGSNIFMSREGKLQLLKFGEPYGTSVTVTEDDMLYNSLQISKRYVPDSVKAINWGKNWSVQPNLTTAIPAEHKQEFATEWRQAKVTDSVVANLYKSEVETVFKDTLLISNITATAECQRLLNYFKMQRTIFRFTGSTRLMSLKIGQPVILTHHRFGLSTGKSGQVVTLNPNWSRGEIEVEVIV